jgi:Spy/CpxP family protein refolding chaperone
MVRSTMISRAGTADPMGWQLRWVALVLALATIVPQFTLADASPSEIATSNRAAHAHLRRGMTLEQQVRALSKALDLDAAQQSELRRLLVNQRVQVSRIWNDAAKASGARVAATRQLSDKTADDIRSLLTEEQRKKFSPPRRATRPDPSDRSVEDWMRATGSN